MLKNIRKDIHKLTGLSLHKSKLVAKAIIDECSREELEARFPDIAHKRTCGCCGEFTEIMGAYGFISYFGKGVWI